MIIKQLKKLPTKTVLWSSFSGDNDIGGEGNKVTEERIAQVEKKFNFFFSQTIYMDAGLKHIVCVVFHFQQDCVFFRNGNKFELFFFFQFERYFGPTSPRMIAATPWLTLIPVKNHQNKNHQNQNHHGQNHHGQDQPPPLNHHHHHHQPHQHR